MKKLASVLMAAFLVVAVPAPAKAEQTCQEVDEVGLVCLTVENGTATVTGPLGIGLSATAPPVEVTVPGPERTVTLPPPAPVTKTAAPQTVTKTETATETATVTETPAPATATVTATPTNTPQRSAAPTGHTSAGQDPGAPDTIVERVVRNVGVPILWIVIGVALAILIQYLMYALGRSDAKHADDRWLEGILNRKRN